MAHNLLINSHNEKSHFGYQADSIQVTRNSPDVEIDKIKDSLQSSQSEEEGAQNYDLEKETAHQTKDRTSSLSSSMMCTNDFNV